MVSLILKDSIFIGNENFGFFGSADIEFRTKDISHGIDVGNLSFAFSAVSCERSLKKSITVSAISRAFISFRESTNFCWYLLFSSSSFTISSNFLSELFQRVVRYSDRAVKSYLQPFCSVSVLPSDRACMAIKISSSLPSFFSM